MHIKLGNPLIYSTRKAFLEGAVVELVYKFNEKSTAKVSRPLKCHSNFLGVTYITSPDHITPARACACRVIKLKYDLAQQDIISVRPVT